MSALAEALVAAQRRAVSAMEKWYVAGALDATEATALMESIGLTDEVDQRRLVCACDLKPCPACAAREAAEWEPDTDAPPLDPEYLALFYGVDAP